jgi:hypothetical protein
MSGTVMSFLDRINPPASATVEVNIPVLVKMYFINSRGYLKNIVPNENPNKLRDLYLWTDK